MIRICIVDDHAVVRLGIRQIIADASDMEVVCEVSKANEVLSSLRRKSCDVLLLDLSMPERHGLEVLKDVKAEFPKLTVLMLSMHSEDQFGIRAMKDKASGYIAKGSEPDELLSAIRKVASGRKYISDKLAELLEHEIHQDNHHSPHDLLSDREYSVFHLIALGKSLSKIAAELNLSAKTVSNYRARVLAKMHMESNSELIRYASKNGLIE